ncbi:MAG: hypothetical protein MMC23_007274 [Stictis urceolatum]|nr:hypothetical protein [Stictis urceolata]
MNSPASSQITQLDFTGFEDSPVHGQSLALANNDTNIANEHGFTSTSRKRKFPEAITESNPSRRARKVFRVAPHRGIDGNITTKKKTTIVEFSSYRAFGVVLVHQSAIKETGLRRKNVPISWIKDADSAKNSSNFEKYRMQSTFTPRRENPGDIYNLGYEVKLGGYENKVESTEIGRFFVAVRKFADHAKNGKDHLIAIRTISKLKHNYSLSMLHFIQNRFFLRVIETYEFNKKWFVITKHLPISLNQIVAEPNYPSESQVAAIVGQILKGIEYLQSESLCHGNLNCTTVLLDNDGRVKIGMQEYCEIIKNQSGYRDVAALGNIMDQLMKRPSRGIENTTRIAASWSIEAKDFLLRTNSLTGKDLSKASA